MHERKILSNLKNDLMKKHLASKSLDSSYLIMYNKLSELLKKNSSPKNIIKQFMNSRLDKTMTFKKKIYKSNIKWPDNKVCSSNKCLKQKNTMKQLRHSFVDAYLLMLKNNNKNNNNKKIKSWSDELNSWKRNYPKYLDNIPFRFYWKTSPLDSSLENEYKYTIVDASNELTKNNQNYSGFKKYIDEKCSKNNSKNKVISFMNTNKDALLIIPCPEDGKNFYTIKDFMDNADKNLKNKFWREAARLIQKYSQSLNSNKHKKLYINTHGGGVPYFHLRVDHEPKYGYSNNIKKNLNINNM
jgi:hypothetical protein